MDKFRNDFHYNYTTEAYKYLGCHLLDKVNKTYVFRVYAPHALAVSVVGDFNNWNQELNPMAKITEEGIWEVKISNLDEYSNYKYWIKNNNKELYKQDPYAYHFETNGGTCSKVYNLEDIPFKNNEWERYNQKPIYKRPLNIYEVHLGSWKRYENNITFDYRKLADNLITYVKEMGYTHIEIMPIMEYPYEGSWGYQVTGYFGITSRYGTPLDFMYLVNKAHENNIGVILDWVPAHFPKDAHGLYEFDGDYVYENPDPKKMEHKSWGTRIFNYSKPEVKSFLISSALFYFDKFKIDGLRVDAVASMIYLDYDRKDWDRNIYGNNHHLEAIEFLKALNIEVFKRHPNALMIAEESTDFANVTKPVDMGGLGFNFKWNMGWMNDTLSFIQTDPLFRSGIHNKLTFSMYYAFSENFILPISHDEVVHGKKSLLDKMPGSYEQKFANLRAYYGYMMTHPGKKLTFMGVEFGQFIEWDYQKELDWLLLDYEKHQKLHKFFKDLNHIYKNNSCLWENDTSWDGFKWINSDDSKQNILSYRRINNNNEELVVIINFSGINVYNYRLGVTNGNYYEILNSDDFIYGGEGLLNNDIKITDIQSNILEMSIVIDVPALSIIILKKEERDEEHVE